MRRPPLLETLEPRLQLSAAPATIVLLQDGFSGASLDTQVWTMPTWQGPSDGTYLGRTQLRVTQNAANPTVSGGVLHLAVDSYNPTGFSFYGTEIFSKQTFTRGDGLIMDVRARLVSPLPGGIVGGMFLYQLKPGSLTVHDEIDWEMLSNDWVSNANVAQTNIYANEPLGAGTPLSYAVGAGTLADFHDYRTEWFPDHVSWFIDGVNVRTITANIPDGPMQAYLSIWVPDTAWAAAYNGNIQPTSNPNANLTYLMDVDSVTLSAVIVPASIETALIAHDPAGNANSAYQFQVRFADTDGTAISAATLGAAGAVVVTGPNGFDQGATLVSVDTPGDGITRTATYQITAPGSTWDLADEGQYQVFLGNNIIADVGGHLTPGRSLGSFFYSSNPLFSERYYLTQYPDVYAATVAGGFVSGYQHYQQYGQAEGRNPSAFFDEAFYQRTYPDVAAAVASHAFKSGFDHFVQYGSAEGRQPSLLFDQGYYLLKYPAVQAMIQAGAYRSALEHFMLTGQYAGNDPSIYFDTVYYLGHNADVAAAIAGGQITSAFAHFLDYGLAEGRNAIDVFDEQWYLAKYPDVAAAVGQGIFRSGYAHYITNGQYEVLRQPSPLFDSQYYLSTYPDVAAAVANHVFPSAFFHYLWTGRAEGRSGHA